MQTFQKKVKELIQELNLSAADVLSVVEPLAEAMRKKSREEIYKETTDWAQKMGISRKLG